MHDVFSGLVNFIGVFSDYSDTEEFCNKVAEALNDRGRDSILVNMLCCPSPQVQNAVMHCICKVRGGVTAPKFEKGSEKSKISP